MGDFGLEFRDDDTDVTPSSPGQGGDSPGRGVVANSWGRTRTAGPVMLRTVGFTWIEAFNVLLDNKITVDDNGQPVDPRVKARSPVVRVNVTVLATAQPPIFDPPQVGRTPSPPAIGLRWTLA